jgi:DNA-binding transcriptional LysR family regulator
MELRHLRYFAAVAEELNFRRAAQRLNVAQPPLSTQIKALERELGVQLLARTTRSVKLTPAGEVFLEEARGILAAAQRAEARARNVGHGLAGTLRMGFLAPTATPRLAAVLRGYREKYPGVELSLHELASPIQLQHLRSDELDVGFLRNPAGYPELETLFVEESPMVLAAPAGHRLAKQRRLQWRDFDQERLVLIHPTLQHGYYDTFRALCAKAGATPLVAQYANDLHSVMWLISAGFGVAPTTQTMSEVKRPGLVFRELPPGLPLVKLCLAWRRNNDSAILRSFLEWFKGAPAPVGEPGRGLKPAREARD